MVGIRKIKVQNVMELSELRRDCAVKQQRGLHFILASVFIWAGILFSVNQILYLLIAMWVFNALLVGLTQTPAVLAGMMLGIEVVFSLALVWENKKDRK